MYDYFTTISCTILRTIGGRGGYCCFENVVSFSLDRIQGIHLSLSDGCRKVRPLRYDETQERRGGVSATNPNVMFFPRWILAKRPIVRPRFPATIGNRTKNTGRADGLIDQRAGVVAVSRGHGRLSSRKKSVTKYRYISLLDN